MMIIVSCLIDSSILIEIGVMSFVLTNNKQLYKQLSQPHEIIVDMSAYIGVIKGTVPG